MHKLALSIVLTSQGISFLHAGTEFLRSKKGVENSFESPDSINAIDWDLKTKNKDVVELVKKLIQMRKQHPAFRMLSAEQIRKNLLFEKSENNLIVYTINGGAVKDSWKKIKIYLNGSSETREQIFTNRDWKLFILNNIPVSPIGVEKFNAAPYSCTILYQ